MRQFNKKVVYSAATAIILAAAAGLFMVFDSSTASAQRGDLTNRGDSNGKVARADQLAVALNFGSASEYTVFGAKGVRGDGSSVSGKSGTGFDEASLGEDGSGLKARSGVTKALAMINQLPCQDMDSVLTGGTFGPAVYCVPSAALAGQMILDAGGDSTASFVFRIAGALKTAENFQMSLTNGAMSGNVYFVAETATLGAWSSIEGSIIAHGTVNIGAGTAIKGRAFSKEGEVILDSGSNVALANGHIQICKRALHDGIASGGFDTGTSNSDISDDQNSLRYKIFQFRINGGIIIEVPTGSCSNPIAVPEGNATITELLDGYYINRPNRAAADGRWYNRFRLASVQQAGYVPANGAPAGTGLTGTNLSTLTATVNVAPASSSLPVILTFTNTFAIPAVIEICKHPSPLTQTGGSPSVPVNDTEVLGFFDFTVSAVPNTTFSMPVNFCTGPIQLLVATIPQTPPGPSPAPGTTAIGSVLVTELAEPGFTLESATTSPANRQFGGTILNLGILNTEVCAISSDLSGCSTFTNVGGGYVQGLVFEADSPSDQTLFNFYNRTNPGRVKVCKIAGPGIPVGTRFRFEVRGRAPSNPFPGPYLPGTDVVRFVDVVAGPPEQGGYCTFADGTFIIGTDVLVTEIAVLDPVVQNPAEAAGSGDNLNQQGPVYQQVPSVSAAGEKTRPIPYQEFLFNGEPYKGSAPPRPERVETQIPRPVDFRSTIKSGWPDLATLALAGPQPAIIGTADATDRAVVFPDPGTAPATQNLVSGLPAGAKPHGVGYFGVDNALIAGYQNSQVYVVQISTASLLSTINTAPAGYNGSGTIAVAPSLTSALAMGSSNILYVIQGPFGPGSVISPVTMLGTMAPYQTQAIVFNSSGRAFVYHSTGISVLDAPYTSVAFTIPVANPASGALGISPDGNTLLATSLSSNLVKIFQAPFSAGSTFTTVTVPGGVDLDGIMIAPNGSHAIVVSSSIHHAASIAAPFSSGSVVESLPLPTDFDNFGFEDVGISADSQLAILAGNGYFFGEPAVLIKAPFTTAGSTSAYMPIGGVGTDMGRGNGAVRFLPPGLAPGLTISKTAPATVESGSNLTYTINYANTGSVAATNVVISDPLPADTSFVSATNGGTQVGPNVVFNIGTVNAGTGGSVSFTVTVNTAAGGTVINSGYTITGDGVPPIEGPPVTTLVTPRPVADLTISKSAPATVVSGSNLTYTINYANTGSVAATNVVISDPLPAGTSFVSATNGGTLQSGNVVFNIGTVNAGTGGSVSFTVTVNTAAGGTVINSNYTITADGVPPIEGPPVTTAVLPQSFPDNIRVSRITSPCTILGAPATVQGIAVNPNPNLTTRQIVFRATRGECVVEFTNFVFQPTVLKICKIAGTGVAVGTPFTFTVTSDTVGGLFNEGTQTVTIEAGPAEQGGFCKLVNGPYDPTNTTPPVGTYRVGARVTVTEAAAPGSNIVTITSPTGTPVVNLLDRTATLTLGFAGGFNELVFTNSVSGGLESDIGERFTGDGDLLSNDVVFVRLFAAGLLSTNPAFNEFQRADAAPRATLGDAAITSADVIQARRYAAALDPPTPAGGPLGPIAPVTVTPLAALRNTGQRTIRAETSAACGGFYTTVAIMLDSDGSEAGAGFTVTFDPAKLSSPEVSLGSDAAANEFILTVNPNNLAAGQLGILLDGPAAFASTPSQRHLVNIRFQVASGANPGPTEINFSGKTILLSTSDALGNLMATDYQPANVTIAGPGCATSTSVTITGRVLSPDGNGLRNATVFITDTAGNRRTVITSSLGYYQFDEVRSGQSYVVGVSNKRYRFDPRLVQVADTLANVDFVGRE